MDSKSYWARREREMKRLVEEEKTIEDYTKRLSKLQKNMMAEIEAEINSFYGKYADKEGISIAEARKRAAKVDIERYQRMAKRIVEERDFSPEANRAMRLYNLTMKVNRLELLKAQIGLHLVDGYDRMDKDMHESLLEEALKEAQRQAGILGEKAPMADKRVEAIVNASFQNATFSERIWNHENHLKNELDSLLLNGIVQGTGSRELARRLRLKMPAKKHEAERLIRTEMARIQTSVQEESMRRNGYTHFVYIAREKACPICRPLDGKVFPLDKLLVGENAPPMHPHCFCSIAEVADEQISGEASEADEWIEAISSAKSIREANRIAGEMGFNADYSGIDVKCANEWNLGLYNAKKGFPEVAEKIKFVGASQKRNSLIRKAATEYYYDYLVSRGYSEKLAQAISKEYGSQVIADVRPDEMASSIGPNNLKSLSPNLQKKLYPYMGITMNNRYFNDYDKVIESGIEQVKIKWHPEGCHTVKATFDHEFAHQIDNYLGIRNSETIQKLFDERTRIEITEGLSRYAWDNDNRNKYAEMIAEGWSEYCNSENPREMAETIGEEIIKSWKKRKNT